MDNGNVPPAHTFFLEFSDEKQKTPNRGLMNSCLWMVAINNAVVNACAVSWVLKTFNNLVIELLKYLKLGSLAVLFDPLKSFQNNFIWMFDSLVIVIKKF